MLQFIPYESKKGIKGFEAKLTDKQIETFQDTLRYLERTPEVNEVTLRFDPEYKVYLDDGSIDTECRFLGLDVQRDVAIFRFYYSDKKEILTSFPVDHDLVLNKIVVERTLEDSLGKVLHFLGDFLQEHNEKEVLEGDTPIAWTLYPEVEILTEFLECNKVDLSRIACRVAYKPKSVKPKYTDIGYGEDCVNP